MPCYLPFYFLKSMLYSSNNYSSPCQGLSILGGVFCLEILMPYKEHSLQSACVAYFRLKWPNIPLYAIPNGAYRHKSTGVMLKAEGVLAGIPDICIPVPSKDGYNALYIEFKRPGGRLSSAQKKIGPLLEFYGNLVKVIDNLYSFDNIIKVYLNRDGDTKHDGEKSQRLGKEE